MISIKKLKKVSDFDPDLKKLIFTLASSKPFLYLQHIIKIDYIYQKN